MKKHILFICILSFAYQLSAQVRIGTVTPADYKNTVGDTLRVLSWNVEHFVDAFDNPYIGNGREDSASEEQVKKRCRNLAEALQRIDADVVVLEEFESQAFLEKIATEFLPNSGYRFFAASPSPNWYMNVVVMSRVPLGTIHGYGSAFTPVINTLDAQGLPESQNQINTRMLSVEVLANEKYAFVLTGLHLKAGRNDRDKAMREGQIQFLLGQCHRFQKENRRSNQLIVGDFNFTPDSPEFKLITSKYRNLQFFSPWPAGTKTHPAPEPNRQIDYIIINKQMQKRLVAGSAKIAQVFSLEKMESISDHLPVVADFVIKH